MTEGGNVTTCPLCGDIPEQKKVEILHGSERLPEEVGRLRVIGGAGIYGEDQIRVCPECGTYYRFIHDHDSEAGMGEGYTDEIIVRITPGKALEDLRKIEKGLRGSIEWWKKEAKQGATSYAETALRENEEQLKRVSEEIRRMSGSSS